MPFLASSKDASKVHSILEFKLQTHPLTLMLFVPTIPMLLKALLIHTVQTKSNDVLLTALIIKINNNIDKKVEAKKGKTIII